jgi:hypothetical protein
MYARAALLLVASLTLTGLSGCYESPDVTVYKPGVYKGAKDPLLALQRSPEQQQKLRERFDRVQMDR